MNSDGHNSKADGGAAAASSRPGALARGVMRAVDRATLSTIGRQDGAPYPSLVLAALDHDGTPLLCLSALAEHTRNALADARAGLLFDGTAGLDEPLTGPRVSVLGRLEPSGEPVHRARYAARHPGAALYMDFPDFALYRLRVERAHLVAGFGRIHWIDAAELLLADPPPALALREADIVGHMNQDHADAIQLYATALLGRSGAGWTMTGIDAEGCDLRRGGEVARLPFDTPIHDGDSARRTLVALVARARHLRDSRDPTV